MKQDKKLAKKVWNIYSEYRRLLLSNAGYCKCITCGRYYPYKGTRQMNLGHYYHKGNGYYTTLDFYDYNLWPQCVGCNYYKSANKDVYTQVLQKDMKEFEKLEIAKRNKRVLVNNELKIMLKEYQKKIKMLEAITL